MNSLQNDVNEPAVSNIYFVDLKPQYVIFRKLKKRKRHIKNLIDKPLSLLAEFMSNVKNKLKK